MSRKLRFKGADAAIGAAVGMPGGGRAVAARNAPVFGEDLGCPLAHHGHHLQRYFPKPIFGNHFTVKCENGDLTFCRFWGWVSKIENIFGEDLETQKGQVDKSGDRENRDFWHILPCVSAIRLSLTLNKNFWHKGLRSSPNREFRENLCETHPFSGRMAVSLRSLPGGIWRCKTLRLSHERV